MCDRCKHILKDFRIEHSPGTCPYIKSLYCSSCAVYGHSRLKCPAKPSSYATEPIYIEQLIPYSERIAYGITSKTLLKNKRIPDPITELENPNLIELKEIDSILKEFLRNNGIIATTKKDIRTKLKEYAKANGKVIRFIPVGKSTK